MLGHQDSSYYQRRAGDGSTYQISEIVIEIHTNISAKATEQICTTSLKAISVRMSLLFNPLSHHQMAVQNAAMGRGPGVSEMSADQSAEERLWRSSRICESS